MVRGCKCELRRIPLLLLLVASLTVTSEAAWSAQWRFPERREAASSLTLIQPGNPAFKDLLDTYFPGVSQEANYPGIRRYLVLVRNDTALQAVAYAIQWNVGYGGNVEEHLSRH